MTYQTSIEVLLSDKDEALLNEAYDYIDNSGLNRDGDAATSVIYFMQSIYRMIAMRHGLEFMTLKGLRGRLNGECLDFKTAITKRNLPDDPFPPVKLDKL